jgi:group I intron endonuclease
VTAGVYWIIHEPTDRVVYVGSSVRVERRIWNHRYLLKKGTHPNTRLQRTWDKYGADGFKITLLEQTDRFVEREQFWLDFLRLTDRVCNLGAVAASPMTGRKQSAEARRKMSIGLRGKVNSEETKRKMSEAKRGKQFSEEHKRNMGLARLGRKLSEEHRRKISIAMQGRKVSDETRQREVEAWKVRRASKE